MQHQRTFFKLICCEPANWPCLVFKTRLHPGLLLASRPGAKNDDCSVGTFVKLMWVHPLWSLQTGHSAGGKKHAAWGKARCSWFWHLSAESPKWFQWCQLDGMFNFAWVAGLRILLGFLGGGGRSAQEMHNSWQHFGPKGAVSMCTKKICWERKK